LTEVLDFDWVSLATRVATVLVAKLLDLLTEFVEAELSAVAKLLLFELLEDSPQDEDFCAEADCASCAALAEEALVAKLSPTD
jgi:hypothetical protein